MCGRYSVNKKFIPKEHRFAGLLEGLNFDKNFDARPSQQLPIILPAPAKAVMAIWASPEKEPDGKPTLPFNIRQESLLFVPRFKSLLLRNRCIIPVDGFFEWKEIEDEQEDAHYNGPVDLFGNPINNTHGKRKLKKPKPPKQKYRFTLKNDNVFGLAGLWKEYLQKETGELTSCFSIITTTANTAVEPFHDRMPVILSEESERIWLNNKLQEKHWLNTLKPYDSRLMQVMAIDEMESVNGNYIDGEVNSK
jgi:putative SOS response-associated peptidase YedK